jgi:hypothetical protein
MEVMEGQLRRERAMPLPIAPRPIMDTLREGGDVMA